MSFLYNLIAFISCYVLFFITFKHSFFSQGSLLLRTWSDFITRSFKCSSLPINTSCRFFCSMKLKFSSKEMSLHSDYLGSQNRNRWQSFQQILYCSFRRTCYRKAVVSNLASQTITTSIVISLILTGYPVHVALCQINLDIINIRVMTAER